jgi:hypothetical protein
MSSHKNSPYSSYTYGVNETTYVNKLEQAAKNLPIATYRPDSYEIEKYDKIDKKAQEKDVDVISPLLPNLLPSHTTDVLHAEVDYNINEVDNIMICKGRLIEIEGSELSDKHGLISKCLFMSRLLSTANLSESNLSSDPQFVSNESKAIIKFNNDQEAEEFINSHNSKYRIVLRNSKTETEANPNVKSVSFDLDSKPSRALPIEDEKAPISSKAIIGINLSKESDSDFVANTTSGEIADPKDATFSNSTKPVEGYETLTIRAKLKQKVGTNRKNQVTLKDIDSIMRKVVTVVQDEFMKRFPSSESTAPMVTNGSTDE